MKSLFSLLLVFLISQSFAQRIIVGKVIDPEGQGIPNATITAGTQRTVSNVDGTFRIQLINDQKVQLSVYALGYKRTTVDIFPLQYRHKPLNIRLNSILREVEIKAMDDPVSTIRLDPKRIEHMPSATGDFNDILSTLGARSNSELSSSYSVRGGNYNENLIYVNGIQVYRPFLVRSGQQEGLSFVNPSLVQSVMFSTGGWGAKYGDKLSSVLDIQYKRPKEFGGSVSLGILNSAAHVEGNKDRLSYTVGIRRKSSRYLLNSLQTKGEYLPQFVDLQSYLHYKINPKTSVGWLSSFADNQYLLRPSDRETNFGTLDKTLRLYVEYQGQEQLKYRTWQNGLKLSHAFSDNVLTNFVVSHMYTREREYSEVEGQYQLSEVINDLGVEAQLDNSLINIGSGKEYTHRRNSLDANIIALENRNEIFWGERHQIGVGIRYSHQHFDDMLNEFAFTDSAQYVTFNHRFKSEQVLKVNRLSAYIQDQWDIDSAHTLTAGVRLAYGDLNQELLLSPSLQYTFRPTENLVFKLASGIYQQPPFYRELRDFDGKINQSLRAQKAWHFILGMDQNFKWAQRSFRWITEVYYKDLWDVIPYDVDDVRLRYYAHNRAKAYAWGMDTRIHGEFIKGTESWLSLGILKTEEDLLDDDRGYIRRPTDQRVQLGVYFEDHLPNNPTWRMNLKLLWSSQLPFGLPNNPHLRATFRGESYRRVDIGFSKLIDEVYLPSGKRFLRSLWIGVDVLNLLGIRNVISHSWISDVNGNQYAIPNALSSRLLNLRVIAKF